MQGIWLIIFLVMLTGTPVMAQTNGDKCHVYVWDLELAERALLPSEQPRPTGPEAGNKEAGLTLLPMFRTKIIEEVPTTKHFNFPNSNLIITATVFYTDGLILWPNRNGRGLMIDSMMLGIALSDKPEENAFYHLPGQATAEVAYNEYLTKVRVKKMVVVNGRRYLIGLECACNTERIDRLIEPPEQDGRPGIPE